MNNGRNSGVDGRISNPTNRGYVTKIINNADTKKKKPEMPIRRPIKTGLTKSLEEEKTKPITKVPVPKNLQLSSENRLKQPIQKLASDFENGKDNSVEKSKISHERKVKPPRVVRDDKITGRRINPVLSEKTYNKGKKALPFQDRVTKPKITKTVQQEIKSKMTSSEDQLIPILTPEGVIENAVVLNNEKTENPPPTFLLAESHPSVFPVSSKKATNDIPSLQVTTFVPEGRIPDKSDLIVMLRRRNSEPYALKYSCLLHNSSDSTNWNPVESFHFWESGPTPPYWEVSLFKSNKSLSVLSHRVNSEMISLAHDNQMFYAGKLRTKLESSETSWIREISSISEAKMDKDQQIPQQPEMTSKNVNEERKPSKIISKDDNYKPPGHLLVYVKSSQKKLVKMVNGSSENPINKKIHKITKINRINSEITPPSSTSSWQKKFLLTVTTFFLLLGTLVFYVMNRPSSIKVTPANVDIIHHY